MQLTISVGLPGGQEVTLIDIGTTGDFVLPSGFELDFGTLPLAVIPLGVPAGQYSVITEFLDPASGATVSSDLERFTIS